MWIKCQNILILLGLLLVSCQKQSTGPCPQTNSISVEPVSYTFQLNSDSLFVSSDSIIKINPSNVYSNEGNDLFLIFEDIYPDSIIHYYSIAQYDTFTFDMLNAFHDIEWNLYIDESNIGDFIDIQLLERHDETHADYRFTFYASEFNMGYIQVSQSIDNDEYGVIIGLAVNPLSEIELDIDEITFTSTIDEFSANGSIYINGYTNAYRLRSESYGDGITQAYEIEVDSEGQFSTTLASSFQVGSDQFIYPTGKLAIYGGVGMPIIVKIKK